MGKRKRVDNKQIFGWIYRLTNLIRNKAYIGQTDDFKRRMRDHKNCSNIDSSYVDRSIRKHGWHNFKVEIILDDVPEEDLDNLETCYIAVENTMAPNGYNLTRGGGGIRGYKHTDESREKMSQAHIRQHANRDRFGTVSFDKSVKKYQVIGPGPESTFIGRYFTKQKAEEALKHYLQTGERMDSDRTLRKKGMGTIRKTKNGKRYEAAYKKNKKRSSKTFDTPEQCEEWLKIELKL